MVQGNSGKKKFSGGEACLKRGSSSCKACFTHLFKFLELFFQVSEFLSELEHIMKAEELLFDPTPGFGPYKQYFPEDAVQHPAKANTLLIQFLIEKFTEEGDTVLDPMGLELDLQE